MSVEGVTVDKEQIADNYLARWGPFLCIFISLQFCLDKRYGGCGERVSSWVLEIGISIKILAIVGKNTVRFKLVISTAA